VTSQPVDAQAAEIASAISSATTCDSLDDRNHRPGALREMTTLGPTIGFWTVGQKEGLLV
jgi:hypothetical protein